MSRSRAETLLVGCTAEAVALLSLRSPPAHAVQAAPPVEVLAVRQVDSPDLAGDALGRAVSELGAEDPGGTAKVCLRVTFDDRFARCFTVTPPRGARSLGELRASAAARFAALYGESADAWRLAGDWQAEQPFFACALPAAAWQRIDGLARSRRWRLESACPAVIRVWNRVHASIPDHGWLAVGFGQTLTLVAIRKGALAGLHTLRVGRHPDPGELEALLDQERLRGDPQATPGQASSLLWAGAADWLPKAAIVAGLPSRLIRFPDRAGRSADAADVCGLALAGDPG